MRCIVAVLCAVLCAGCSASQKIEIRVVNTTPYPLTVLAKSWIFSGTIILPPGGSWSGSVDRRLVGKRIEITVSGKYP